MTAQVKALATPVLKEAVNGVLHVGKLEGSAHAVVPPPPGLAVGDLVSLRVATSMGNDFQERIVVTAAEIGKPLTIAIPKHVFEKNLVSDASAKIDYSVTKMSQPPETSPTLTVKLER